MVGEMKVSQQVQKQDLVKLDNGCGCSKVGLIKSLKKADTQCLRTNVDCFLHSQAGFALEHFAFSVFPMEEAETGLLLWC